MLHTGLVRLIAARFIAGRFIAGSMHRKVDSSKGRFITGSIYRESIHRGSIHRRINLSQGRFIAELCQLKTWLKREIFCLEIQNRILFVVKPFSSPLYWNLYDRNWSEHENWVHLIVKIISSPPGATEKLVWLNCKQTGSAMYRTAMNRSRLPKYTWIKTIFWIK
jgi:hypothetical protein